MIIGCYGCYGRGFIWVRAPYGRYESAGPILQYVCQLCMGQKRVALEEGWYIKPRGIDEAVKWLRDAEPPALPFKLYPHCLVENPEELYDQLKKCDPRFHVDNIMRLHELFGPGEDL